MSKTVTGNENNVYDRSSILRYYHRDSGIELVTQDDNFTDENKVLLIVLDC